MRVVTAPWEVSMEGKCAGGDAEVGGDALCGEEDDSSISDVVRGGGS